MKLIGADFFHDLPAKISRNQRPSASNSISKILYPIFVALLIKVDFYRFAVI
jgi:hypothetical protein